jgi:hypothetical protein
MEIIVLQLCEPKSVFYRQIGAHQLAWYLRQFNYTVQVINISCEFTVDDIKLLIDKFRTSETKIIGLSGIILDIDNHPIFGQLVGIFQELKINHPDINLVIGGSSAHVLKNRFKKIVNYYFEGHAENSFKCFADWVIRNNTTMPQINIDKFGFKVIKESSYIGEDIFKIENCKFRWHESDAIQQGETLPLETSRGCVFKCKFCQYPLIGKSKRDYLKPIEFIREELIDNYQRFNVTNYYILDDTWNADVERIEEFHKMTTTLPFKIQYATYLRLDLIHAHKHTEDLLLDSGLKGPFFGIESFNEKAAKFIGKSFSGDRAKDYLLYLLKDAWKGNMYEQLSFIAGLPYTSFEDVRADVNWCVTNKIQSYVYPPLSINKVDEGYFTSEFERDAEKYGFTWIENQSFLRRIWSHESGVNYKLALEWSQTALSGNPFPKHGAWMALQMLQYGFTEEELKVMAIFQRTSPKNTKKILNFINRYKQTLLSM